MSSPYFGWVTAMRIVPVATATLAYLCISLGGPSLAASGPARAVLSQKQLVSRANCETAAQAKSKPDFLSKSAEYRDDVQITTRYCSATAHNQLSPASAQIVVVGADPTASGQDKIFIKTISKHDAAKVHDTCLLAATSTSAYLQSSAPGASPASGETTGADVMTGSGKVDCQEFLRATAAEDPLVVLAPAMLTGTAISVPILSMIGNRKTPAEVQAAIDGLGSQLAGSIAMSADEIRKHPQIIAGPDGPGLQPASR